MISVIICTYNRVDALQKCLKAFERVQFDHPWELVVVNNNCTDGTAEFLNNYRQTSSLPLVTCVGKQQGLGNARNAGLAVSRYDIIAYTDDDCYPEPDYLTAIARNFADESVSFFGGRVLLFDPTDLNITVKLSEEVQDFPPYTVMRPGAIHGANFMFRKSILEKANGFDPLFGAGAKFPCEDVDTMAECLRLGGAGRYVPDIVVHHDHGRKTQAEFEKLKHSYDIGRGAYYTKRALFSPGQRFMYSKFWFFKMRQQPLRKTYVEIASGVRYIIARLF
ncbi:glycosyltransferase family 2 protein [Alteromonas pelagimontana]|uniref:Glycosyltransferase family 2 protein n=1 Tax=Alteromonas pelagimontana TaxID=1858656 RepID=A0A6M4MGI0_9ALTE|nr:glycosyltransferase family A protein [Alteromonas pelagimontana]QJR81978.1 glycosyltransferase family 2 protein [Alteromonas pelagimontana]